MKWALAWCAAIVLAAACARNAEDQLPGDPPESADVVDCGVRQPAVLTDSGIGALTIGATVAEVRSRCMVLADSLEPGPEGQTERRVVVVTGSVNTAAAIVDDRVWRIYVATPRIKTADSLGVGSTVGDLRAPEARLARGEGTFVLREDHCGLSFQLASGVPPNAQTLDAVPDSIRVERVLVIGCGQP